MANAEPTSESCSATPTENGIPTLLPSVPPEHANKTYFSRWQNLQFLPVCVLGGRARVLQRATHSTRTYQVQYAAVILRPVANVVYCALNGDRSVRAANRCGGRRDEVEVEHKSHGIKWPLPNRRGRPPSPQVFCTNSHGTLGLFKSHLQHWWPRACTCCLRTACLSLGRCCFCFAVVSACSCSLSLVCRGRVSSLPRSPWDSPPSPKPLVKRRAAAVPSVLRRRGEETADCRSAVAASLLAGVLPPSHVSGSSRSLVVERRGHGARIHNFASSAD